MLQRLALVIPYDGADYEDITEIDEVFDPSLKPVDWEIIETLDPQSIIIGSPWGQYYKLESQPGSAWNESYRILHDVKKLEDAAEKAREAGSHGEIPENVATASFSGTFQQGGPHFHQPSSFNEVSYFGSSLEDRTLFPPGAGPFLPVVSGGLFGTSRSDQSTEKATIERYHLSETLYPANTRVDGMILQHWFLDGKDSLKNAFVSTFDKPETLRNILLAILQPRFETMLTISLCNDSRMYIKHISCACAYALKILHRQGPEAFAYVLSHAPSSVFLDTALFARGALIMEMEYQVLQAAAIALTASEHKDTKEITYARGVAVMIAAGIDQFYKEDKNKFGARDEDERGERLKNRMSLLIKKVFDTPVTMTVPADTKDNKSRAALAAAAALSALILAGALTFADDLQSATKRTKLVLRLSSMPYSPA